ncbi:RNA polymerase I-specific transcription initiation factor RRN3-like isoform X2 [Varroa destructor]|nr:RNA polymerase I-specific transcription initiation factor RRN3-like isoform X2 [Varroa destructor]XP_022660076.1 RNA polymerase I-specific transcription initiation factor RRN3-like isoform X2 [Varroa destructor]XP_022660077.1 RNA polymerase I-specific transcription initiation factor RRN3-like isoform X2 [Varroa destructor]XP_022660078.1 RNA polymerase I-specific transcription initiation factor RRN3-like isoform X2 [Varroa destructor]
MASLVATNETPKPVQSRPEFLTPQPVPRRDGTLTQPATSSGIIHTAMNFVEVLSEASASRAFSDKYRLILASLKSIHTGVRSTNSIPPVQLLNELAKMTSLLDGFNEVLVVELFKFKILSLQTDILAAYLHLLVELARSNTFHYDEICRLLLSTMASIEDEKPPEDQLDLVHKALQQMIQELPHFSDVLLKQISKCLPFMTKPWSQQVNMYRQVLRIVDYVPTQLSLDVLSRLVHKIIDLDCHCPKEEMLTMEETVDDTVATQFTMDSAENDSTIKEQGPTKHSSKIGSDSQPSAISICNREMKHSLGNALDRLMELLFEYIDSHVTGSLDEAKATYRRFLAVFDKYIMATYKCLHVQFLMFYICSKRPLFMDHLIDFLWHKVQDPNTPVVFRQISVAYLGSLLSRAAFVSVGTLKDTLTLLSRFLHSYIAQSSSAQLLGVDVNRHATFYAVCQSLLYCVAFRHKDIAESTNGLEFLRSLNLEQLITSPLNPLKIMSKSIATNFANVSRHYQVVYCHAIIERNQRSALPMAHVAYGPHNAQTASGQTSQCSTIIEGYFPFDPYVLIRSRRWIEPIYRHYVDYLSSAGDLDDDEDEDVEEMDDETSGGGGEDGSSRSRVMKIDRQTSITSASPHDASVAMSIVSANSSLSGQGVEKLFAYSVSPGFIH